MGANCAGLSSKLPSLESNLQILRPDIFLAPPLEELYVTDSN